MSAKKTAKKATKQKAIKNTGGDIGISEMETLTMIGHTLTEYVRSKANDKKLAKILSGLNVWLPLNNPTYVNAIVLHNHRWFMISEDSNEPQGFGISVFQP